MPSAQAMHSNSNHISTRSVCFIGNSGHFSLTAFNTLHAQGVRISRIILAGPSPAPQPGPLLPVSTAITDAPTPATIVQQARLHGIPIHFVAASARQPDPWQEILRHPAPDMLLVACFPSRLPERLLRWAKHCALNLHPSLLPDYRGPNPVFWQLHQGESHTGVTLHHLSEELDAGPIARQQAVHFPLGASCHDLNTLLAREGSEMFIQLLTAPTIAAKQQHAEVGSYFSAPTTQDYSLDTTWSALRAFNFMRGTHSPERDYPLSVDHTTVQLTKAIAVDPAGVLPAPFIKEADMIHLQFSPGVLLAKYL